MGASPNPSYEKSYETDYEYYHEYHNIFHILAETVVPNLDPKIVRFFLKNKADPFSQKNGNESCFKMIFQSDNFQLFLILFCNINFYIEYNPKYNLFPSQFQSKPNFYEVALQYEKHGHYWCFENHHLFPKKFRYSIFYMIAFCKVFLSQKIPRPILFIIISLLLYLKDFSDHDN